MNMLKQRIKTKKNITIKKLNDYFDKMIDKSKSFEDQIESSTKVKNLDGYFINDFDDKELKSNTFKLKLSNLLKTIGEKLFKKTLANKLIITKNKEENQIIVKNTNKNRNKLYEMDLFDNDWMIQPSDQCIDLMDAIDLILDFNENENENVNDETIMSSDKEDDDDDDDEPMSQNEI